MAMNQPQFQLPPGMSTRIPGAGQGTNVYPVIAPSVSYPAPNTGSIAQTAPITPPTHRFGDINADPTYAPKSAPKQEREFEKTYRYSFEEGVHYLRFIAHPILLPSGFHYSTWHHYPDGESGKDVWFQCPESYAPNEPCYTCSLVMDLDDAKNNKNDSVLNVQNLGDRLFNLILENSTKYARTILLPFIARGRVGMVAGKSDPTKSYRQVYPDPSQYCTGILNLSPDKPHPEYGTCQDQPFYRRLQILTLTDTDIMTQYQSIAMHDPEQANKFYAEASPIFRNPNLFDAQQGSWVAYNKGKKGVPMTLVCQPPSPLDTTLITKYMTEKVYPNIRSWGSGGNTKQSKRLSWYEQQHAWQFSWAGKQLAALPWDLSLDPNDWVKHLNVPTHINPQEVPF